MRDVTDYATIPSPHVVRQLEARGLGDSERDVLGVPVGGAGMAVGAILAGLAWARLRQDPAWPTALGRLLLASGLAQTGAAVAALRLVLVGVVLIAVGGAAAPVIVVAFTGADSLVAPEERTEASTWVSAALNGGNALGTALAGLVFMLASPPPLRSPHV
ncbi:hypothetical protein GCM10023350_36570 [Nocardioides endophyticus]|uniref:MFS transporter n=1 Tax=Nocardioides endophyticus TaxID=1353775 RepID=A0ABP8Z6W7_9ACTN